MLLVLLPTSSHHQLLPTGAGMAGWLAGLLVQLSARIVLPFTGLDGPFPYMAYMAHLHGK